jgi:hypothetical protein
VPVDAVTPEQLRAYEALIEGWLDQRLSQEETFVAAERDAEVRRWYVRLRGEERDFIAIWLTLAEYTLQYETYFIPAPEEDAATVYETLMRINHRLYGMAFAIGPEDAIYLTGHMPLSALDEDELDRIVGSTYEYVERWFRPIMRIAFASRFKS